jgi:tetrahydromethanopterin S-methyltransferase subunit G
MKKQTKSNALQNLFNYLNNHVNALNNSKLFAGLMIIILNIASRFVTIKLSKTMEAYLKFTFSRDVLIFAIAWMGTRDIYVAFIVVIGFIICMDFIFNENSQFCILTEHFTDYHTSLLQDKISDDDIKKAKETLEKAEKQKIEENNKTHTKCTCGNVNKSSNNKINNNDYSIPSFLQSNSYSNYS